MRRLLTLKKLSETMQNNPLPVNARIKIKYAEGEPPFIIDLKMLKDLSKAKIIYSDFAEKVKPVFNIKAEGSHRLSIYDVKDAVLNIERRADPISAFKEWFWLVTDILGESLKVNKFYDRDLFSDFPQNEKEIFSTVLSIAEDLYWRIEHGEVARDFSFQGRVRFKNPRNWAKVTYNEDFTEEEKVFYETCLDITERIESYLKNRKLPECERTYSRGQMRHFIGLYDNDKSIAALFGDFLKLYKSFTEELAKSEDPYALRVLAFGYFYGNRAYRRNIEKSKEYLLSLYRQGDFFAALALGSIYFYGLSGKGEPDYFEAYKYYSYAASAGLEEALCKCAYMILYGRGVPACREVGVNMLIRGYRNSLMDFCAGKYENTFADYAYLMGKACVKGLIWGLDGRDAYKFFLECRFAINQRRHKYIRYGDGAMEKTVAYEIVKIESIMGKALKKSVLKADYPIYMNQIFEGNFPVRVYISKDRGEKKYRLRLAYFKPEDDALREFAGEELDFLEELIKPPKILVSYPELSYVGLADELSFELEGVTVLKRPEGEEYFLCDGFRRNEQTKAIEFYSGGAMCAVVKAKWYVIYVKKD